MGVKTTQKHKSAEVRAQQRYPLKCTHPQDGAPTLCPLLDPGQNVPMSLPTQSTKYKKTSKCHTHNYQPPRCGYLSSLTYTYKHFFYYLTIYFNRDFMFFVTMEFHVILNNIELSNESQTNPKLQQHVSQTDEDTFLPHHAV